MYSAAERWTNELNQQLFNLNVVFSVHVLEPFQKQKFGDGSWAEWTGSRWVAR